MNTEEMFLAIESIEPMFTLINAIRQRFVRDGYTDDEARTLVVAAMQLATKPATGSNQ